MYICILYIHIYVYILFLQLHLHLHLLLWVAVHNLLPMYICILYIHIYVYILFLQLHLHLHLLCIAQHYLLPILTWESERHRALRKGKKVAFLLWHYEGSMKALWRAAEAYHIRAPGRSNMAPKKASRSSINALNALWQKQRVFVNAGCTRIYLTGARKMWSDVDDALKRPCRRRYGRTRKHNKNRSLDKVMAIRSRSEIDTWPVSSGPSWYSLSEAITLASSSV